MRLSELFYWLQGYFELSAIVGPADLNPAQFDCILRHIALVSETPDSANRLRKIQFLCEMAFEGSMSIEVAIKKIKAEVHGQFVHVIDPAAGGPEVQAKLNAIHGNIDGRPNMRC